MALKQKKNEELIRKIARFVSAHSKPARVTTHYGSDESITHTELMIDERLLLEYLTSLMYEEKQ